MRTNALFGTPTKIWGLVAGAAVLLTACAPQGERGPEAAGTPLEATAAAVTGIRESSLPPGFEAAPTVTIEGKQLKFDTIPGHYWKVLDDRGFAMGLHFQSEEPFRWAEDAEDDELLYLVYAIPGNCEPGGSFSQAVKSQRATVLGPVPPGFDHWHGLLGAGPKHGHWLMHVPVRDFTFAGPEGNPLDGEEITGGIPKFIPVCEPR